MKWLPRAAMIGLALLIAAIIWLATACSRVQPLRPAAVAPDPVIVYVTVDDLLADLMDDLDELERVKTETHEVVKQ